MITAGVAQFEPVWGDKKANFAKIERMVGGERIDLLVLPELATTGYIFRDKKELARHAEVFPAGPTGKFLTRLARRIKGYVVCGVAEREADAFYNSAVLYSAKGLVGTYRKLHLFDREKEVFEPGNLGLQVFDIGIARVGMMVCFDWIFPESARSLALWGAEVIAHPANLVLPYCPRAALVRAVENRVFYLLSDRVGREKRGGRELEFIGQSRIIDTKGEILADLGTDEGLVTARIDPLLARDKQVTPRNNIFEDRRPDQYRLD